MTRQPTRSRTWSRWPVQTAMSISRLLILYLWFDPDTDGVADSGEMQALSFNDPGIDVSQFDDVVTDTATGWSPPAQYLG